MGTPDFAVAPLQALLERKYNIVGVVTVADKPSGRGQKVNESAVKKFAVEHGIPVLQPVKLEGSGVPEAAQGHEGRSLHRGGFQDVAGRGMGNA